MDEHIKELDPEAVTPTYEVADPKRLDHIPDVDDATPECQDNYISAEVTLPFQGTERTGKVKKQSRTQAGELYGKANENPILDTRSYDVEFPDGTLSLYTANVIAQNVMSQCNEHGNVMHLMEGIVGHKTDGSEILHEDRCVRKGTNRHLRKTMKGWFLCVQWKGGLTSWERLSNLKESYPIQVAEYATINGINNMPAFAWWAPHTLKKRDQTMSAVNKRHRSRTHKFGIKIPKTVKRALEIDKENGNALWADAIAKEMKNIRIAFKVLNDDEKAPVGCHCVDCHMIFDCKMESNFRRKARLVAGGHMTESPEFRHMQVLCHAMRFALH